MGRTRPYPPEDLDDASAVAATFATESTYRLVDRVRHGDGAAVEEICRRYLPRLRRWAHGRVPNALRASLDTDDLVQDVLLQTIRRFSRIEYRRSHALQAYLRAALENRIRDAGRRSRRTPATVEIGEDVPLAQRSPLELLIGADRIRRYESALARLRPLDREAIVARIDFGCSYAEIADALNRPSVEAARKTVHRAVLRLAEELARDR